MTPVFCCGFECGVSANNVVNASHWTDLYGTSVYSTTTKRSGARSLKIGPTTGSNFSSQTTNACTGLGDGGARTAVGRFYVYFEAFPSSEGVFLLSWYLPTSGGIYFQTSDSKIYCTVDYTNGSSGFQVTTGTWYRIDWKWVYNGTTMTVDAQVDGVALGTAGPGSPGVAVYSYLYIGSVNVSTGATIYFDDVVVSKTSDDYPIGPGYVNHFVPTSDGSHNIASTADFKHGESGTDILNATTDAYTLVDEVPLPSGTPSTTDLISAIAPPNATDYVECVFGPASGISTPTAGPRAVECVFAAHQAGTQSGSYKVNLNDNGSVGLVYEQAGVAGATSFQYKTKQFPTAPSTSGAWGVTSGNANFNNLRFRFYSADAAPDQYLDAIMIEAEFASPAAAFMPRPNSPILQGIKRASFW